MIAHLRNVRLAPQKINLVAGLVRRLPALHALEILAFTPKKGARVLERVLRSALANAEHNVKQRREHLYVKTLIVNQGTALRRGVPRARGSVRPIRKFTSHVTLELGVVVPDEKKTKKSKSSKSPKSASSISSTSSHSSSSSS